jgi:hypothetical protein
MEVAIPHFCIPMKHAFFVFYHMLHLKSFWAPFFAFALPSPGLVIVIRHENVHAADYGLNTCFDYVFSNAHR